MMTGLDVLNYINAEFKERGYKFIDKILFDVLLKSSVLNMLEPSDLRVPKDKPLVNSELLALKTILYPPYYIRYLFVLSGLMMGNKYVKKINKVVSIFTELLVGILYFSNVINIFVDPKHYTIYVIYLLVLMLVSSVTNNIVARIFNTHYLLTCVADNLDKRLGD